MFPVRLQGDRVVLRELRPDDLDAAHAWGRGLATEAARLITGSANVLAKCAMTLVERRPGTSKAGPTMELVWQVSHA